MVVIKSGDALLCEISLFGAVLTRRAFDCNCGTSRLFSAENKKCRIMEILDHISGEEANLTQMRCSKHKVVSMLENLFLSRTKINVPSVN